MSGGPSDRCPIIGCSLPGIHSHPGYNTDWYKGRTAAEIALDIEAEQRQLAQQEACLRGEHESGRNFLIPSHIPGLPPKEYGFQNRAFDVCKHCKCLYIKEV